MKREQDKQTFKEKAMTRQDQTYKMHVQARNSVNHQASRQTSSIRRASECEGRDEEDQEYPTGKSGYCNDKSRTRQ